MSYTDFVDGYAYPEELSLGMNAMVKAMNGMARKELVQFLSKDFVQHVKECADEDGLENPMDKLDPNLVLVSEVFERDDIIDAMVRFGLRTVAQVDSLTERDIVDRLGLKKRDIRFIAKKLSIFGITLRN